jgi:myo-inositol 2-dehydrogenase/D-chiro-inositol 1-dehydrogenase
MRDSLFPALRAVDSVVVCGVCDPLADRAESLAGQIVGATAFSTVEKMIALGTPDLLVGACPPEGHEEVVVESLASGLPVFVEKPPAGSLAALQRLADKAVARCMVTGVGMNFRFSTAYVTLKEMLRSGEFGTPVAVTVAHVASRGCPGSRRS